jgi:hypothetical protein
MKSAMSDLPCRSMVAMSSALPSSSSFSASLRSFCVGDGFGLAALRLDFSAAGDFSEAGGFAEADGLAEADVVARGMGVTSI